MVITHLKSPHATLKLCWLIRVGKFRSTSVVRQAAKAATFAMAYSQWGTQDESNFIVPTNSITAAVFGTRVHK